MDYLDLFLEQNPWQQEKKIPVASFIDRNLLSQITPWLEREEAIILSGPRQSGKTTILFKIIDDLLNHKGQDPKSIYYFNFDQEEVRENFKKPQMMLSFTKSRGDFSRYWLFLDEVQRLPEAGLYLKTLYDLPYKPFKLIVSGSSSLLLKAKTKEHLTGRQIEFKLYPLSFQEGAKFYGFVSPSTSLLPVRELIREFAVYGSYPKIFQEKNQQIKEQLLVQLYHDYVHKDVRDFAGIERVLEFNKLASLLAYQIGSIISKEELAGSTQLDIRTLMKYLEILEETYVVKMLSPYFSNRRKEIVKSPKIYFLDNGLRNAQLLSFLSYEKRPDKGKLFENLVFGELLKNMPSGIQIRYWRTQAGAEVDFVLVANQDLVPIEVKTTLKEMRLGKNVMSFIETYKPKRTFFISESFSGRINFKNTIVHFLPFSRVEEVFSL